MKYVDTAHVYDQNIGEIAYSHIIQLLPSFS
jgi:hypothetical protein